MSRPHTIAGSRPALDPARRRRHEAVAALVAGVFLADLVYGGISPIFPLFAKHLGASSSDLAALVTAAGLTSLVFVLPSARLADRIGKRAVFSTGVLLYGVVGLVLAAIGNVALLALPQAVVGLASVCTWTIGTACLADTVTGPALATAIGIYTGAMGAGYGVGPLITGWSVGAIGYRMTFLWCGLLGVASAAGTMWGLWHARAGAAQHGAGSRPVHAALPAAAAWPPRLALRLPGRWRQRPSSTVLLASFVNLPATLSINIGILTFFPVYAASLGWSTSLIGAILFARAMASAFVRLGMRAVQRLPFSPLVLIRTTLFVEVVLIGLLAVSRNVVVSILLLVAEGANYGVTISFAQLTIVRGTDAGNSASSLVWYNATSAVAQLVGGGFVALLVSGHSARGAIVVVAFICLVLACTYAAGMAARGRRSGAAERLSGTLGSPG